MTKKLLTRSRIVLLAGTTAILGLAAVDGHAASTGSITIQGTIAASCNITVASVAGFNTLDLTTNQTALQVANVTEQCNDPKGYTVSLATTNGTTTGLLKGAIVGNTDTVSYTVTYGAAAVTLAAGTATVTNVNAKTALAGVTNALKITYTGNTNLGADVYTDTLTVTITGK